MNKILIPTLCLLNSIGLLYRFPSVITDVNIPPVDYCHQIISFSILFKLHFRIKEEILTFSILSRMTDEERVSVHRIFGGIAPVVLNNGVKSV